MCCTFIFKKKNEISKLPWKVVKLRFRTARYGKTLPHNLLPKTRMFTCFQNAKKQGSALCLAYRLQLSALSDVLRKRALPFKPTPPHTPQHTLARLPVSTSAAAELSRIHSIAEVDLITQATVQRLNENTISK